MRMDGDNMERGIPKVPRWWWMEFMIDMDVDDRHGHGRYGQHG